jgi:hypothetical protein
VFVLDSVPASKAVKDRHIHVAVRPAFAARYAAEQVDRSRVLAPRREDMRDFLG